MALLAYLAVTGHSHSRESLAALFWPEMDDRRARGALRSTLSRLRRSLGGAWLVVDRETVGLDGSQRGVVDVLWFRDLLARGRTHGHPSGQACPDCLSLLAEAVELCRADFLAGFTLRDSPQFDDWQSFQTEALRRELAGALEILAEGYAAQGDVERAIACGQRWIGLDRLEEAAHRCLMRLYAGSGQQAAALRQAEAVEQVLREELGVSPGAETLELWQAIREGWVPQLQATLPVLTAAVSAYRSSLPSQTTPFVGREAELVQIAQLLSEPSCRLLTVVGPGGIGKTRLTIQAAQDQIPHFTHGAHFVPLVSLDSVEMLASTILDALDAPLSVSLHPREQLLNVLRDRQILLTLDNFEHLLEGVPLLAEILQGAPELKLLATSRERLNLREEWLLPLRGMQFPDEEEVERAREAESTAVWPGTASEESLSVLEGYNALRLFVQCARRVRPDFSLATAGASWVARICQLVEGMPLAIELAAPWVRIMSCRAIAQEIKGNLDLLATRLRDVPQRHRSMRAVFDHSWGLLSAEERDILRHLSVFRGGFHRGAAEAVALRRRTGNQSAPSSPSSLAVLSDLVDRSWLRVSTSDRYEMHELVRQYCADKLGAVPAAGDQEGARQVQDRHSRYYAAFLQEREPHLLGHRQREAFQEILEDMDNVWAAWNWAMERGHVDTIGKCVRSLEEMAELRGWHHDVHQAFDRAAAKLREQLDATTHRQESASAEEMYLVLAEILRSQYSESYKLGSHERSRILCEESLALLRQAGQGERQRRAVARAKGGLGFALCVLGDTHTGNQLMREAVILSEEVNDSRERAWNLMLLSVTPRQRGRYREAEELLEQALAIARNADDLRYEAWCLGNLIGVLEARGEYDRASQLAQEAFRIRQDLGDRAATASSYHALGRVAALLGDYELAAQHYESALAIARDVGDPNHERYALDGLGRTASALGQHGEAKGWFEESLAIAAKMGWLPVDSPLDPLIGLGHATCALGEHDRSKQFYCQALATAMKIQEIRKALDALVGLASLSVREGEPERAVEILALVAYHPASMKTTRDNAQELLSQLASELSPEVFAAATSRGQARELDDVVTEILGR